MNLGATEAGKIVVEWEAGATGKATDGNTVEFRLAGDPQWTIAVSQTRNTVVEIKNLQPNARYDIRVFSSSQKMPLPNYGIEKAELAAKEVRGTVITPQFAKADLSTDWNDVYTTAGKADGGLDHRKAYEATYKAIAVEFARKGISDLLPPRHEMAERVPAVESTHKAKVTNMEQNNLSSRKTTQAERDAARTSLASAPQTDAQQAAARQQLQQQAQLHHNKGPTR
jgi:hypothetical protein